MFPEVPQSSLGILRVPQLPPPLDKVSIHSKCGAGISTINRYAIYKCKAPHWLLGPHWCMYPTKKQQHTKKNTTPKFCVSHTHIFGVRCFLFRNYFPIRTCSSDRRKKNTHKIPNPPPLRIPGWTLQWKGEWTCMTVFGVVFVGSSKLIATGLSCFLFLRAT